MIIVEKSPYHSLTGWDRGSMLAWTFVGGGPVKPGAPRGFNVTLLSLSTALPHVEIPHNVKEDGRGKTHRVHSVENSSVATDQGAVVFHTPVALEWPT